MDEPSVYTKKRIENVVLKMMEKKPYYAIKVSSVVELANVSRSTFYFYFDSIDSVVDTMENEIMDALPRSDDVALSYQLVHHNASITQPAGLISAKLEKHLDAFHILSGPNGRPEFAVKFRRKAMEIFRLIARRPILDKSVEAACEMWAGAQWYLYTWWAAQEPKITCEELAQLGELIKSINSIFYQ